MHCVFSKIGRLSIACIELKDGSKASSDKACATARLTTWQAEDTIWHHDNREVEPEKINITLICKDMRDGTLTHPEGAV